jgi:hypothetical protein
MGLGAEEHDLALVALAAQGFRGPDAGERGSHDDDAPHDRVPAR